MNFIAEMQILKRENSQLQAENEKLRKDLIETNYELVAQNCTRGDVLDSMAISTNARAMRFLAERGIIKIEKEHGRRIIGKWAKGLKGE